MRTTTRWVGLMAVCVVTVAPQAHAQIGTSEVAAGASAAQGAATQAQPAHAAGGTGVITSAGLRSAARAVDVRAVASTARSLTAGLAGLADSPTVSGARPANAAPSGFVSMALLRGAARSVDISAVAGHARSLSTALPGMPGASPTAAVTPTVVVRRPVRDFGSGYPRSYASQSHVSSSARGYRAAAKSPNGCLVIGDSIAALTSVSIDAELAARGVAGCAYEVWNGRPAEGAVDALQRIAKAHGLPGHVVMISGANDVFNPHAFRAQVERAATIVGPRRTLTWASVFVRRTAAGTAAADLKNSRWLNILLSRTAARRPNVKVVNWYGFLAQRQRRLSEYLRDGVHPTEEGRKALARMIVSSW